MAEKKKILKLTEDRVLEAAERCSDAKAIFKVLFPEIFHVAKGIGDRFLIGSNEYIVAQIAPNEVCLVSLQGSEGGNRWKDGVTVMDTDSITSEEWSKIIGSLSPEEVVKIKEK